MRCSLDFEVVDWHEHLYVTKIRVFGTGPDGEPVDKVVNYGEPVDIATVRKIVAKMNNGSYRL